MELENTLKKTYQDEQNEILESLLFDLIYHKIQMEEKGERHISIELFITSTCNKDCSYCYLQKYQDKLCPKELRDPKLIIKNMNILLEHFKEKCGKIHNIDLFTGEIWESKLGLDVFETLLTHIKNGLEVDQIVIPSNASFIHNAEATKNIRKYIQEFKKNDCRLIFSFSVDGLIVEQENRPFKDSNRKDLEDFYDKLFAFADDYGFAFHPMIAASTIEKQIENFNWWKQKCDENFLNIIMHVMMLEVRDPNAWTDEKIYSYLEFLKYYIEIVIQDKKYYDGNVVEYLYNAISMLNTNRNGGMLKDCSYVPFLIRSVNKVSCSVTQHLCIRLGDLAIVPCHRLAYDKLLYGKYNVENDKIVGVTSLNNPLAINHWVNGYKSYFKCDTCALEDFCIKGCQGAQFEDSGELYYPIESVCNLQFAKTIFLIFNYTEMFNKLRDQMTPSQQKECELILARYDQIFNRIQTENKELCNTWMPIITTQMKLNY